MKMRSSKRAPKTFGANGKKNKADMKGVIILAFVLVSVGFLLWFYQSEKQKLVALNQETYCPTDGPFGVTIVLLDLTDPISFLQERALQNLLGSLSDTVSTSEFEVGQYELLEVYLLNTAFESELPQPIVSACNPGDGKGLSEFTANPRLARKRFVERFQAPIGDALKNIVNTEASNSSPLIETIRGIALKSFQLPANAGHQNRLIIISDMLQHSQKISHYRGDQAMDATELSRFSASLQLVESVNLKVLDRPTLASLQGANLIAFWDKYFRISGSRLVGAERWSE